MTSGIHQGCPVSVASFNLLMTPLIRHLELHHDKVMTTIYADDLSIYATEHEALSAAAMDILEYCEIMQWQVNPQKTQLWGWSCRTDHVFLKGERIKLQKQGKLLGTTFGQRRPAAAQRKQRHQQLQASMDTLKHLPLSARQKVKVVNSILTPKYTYDTGEAEWTSAQERSLRNQLLQCAARSSASQSTRCPLMSSLLLPGAHRTDPRLAYWWAQLMMVDTLYQAIPTITEQDEWYPPLQLLIEAASDNGDEIKYVNGQWQLARQQLPLWCRDPQLQGQWAHQWRMIFRDWLFSQSKHRDDTVGVGQAGVDW